MHRPRFHLVLSLACWAGGYLDLKGCPGMEAGFYSERRWQSKPALESPGSALKVRGTLNFGFY